MTNQDLRRIRGHWEEHGRFKAKQVFAMRKRNEIDSTAEFFSTRLNRWRVLPEYMEEEHPSSLQSTCIPTLRLYL